MDSDDGGMLDMSIIGDEEEQHRIELEHNLQDLSIQFSTSNHSQLSDHEHGSHPFRGDARNYDCSSDEAESFSDLEYPRHDPRPIDTSIFHGQASFLDHTQLENDYDSNFHSHRSREDDRFYYTADTMSTAAHHASAMTLSAGLAGRSGKGIIETDASMSGAEYDPDRPLEKVMNGMVNDLSMLTMNAPYPRGSNRKSVPIPIAKRKLKLSNDYSRELGFADVNEHTINGSVLGHTGKMWNYTDSQVSARKHDGMHSTSGHMGSYTEQSVQPKAKRPMLNVQPPTPSTGNASNASRFSKLAKTLDKEIGKAQHTSIGAAVEKTQTHGRKKQDSRRNPFQNIVNQPIISHLGSMQSSRVLAKAVPNAQEISRSMHSDRTQHFQSKYVQLPDVTGLTSAVASPLKRDTQWRRYSGDLRDDEAEGHLVQTLTCLQTRLNQLESQNLVSRRRVRELEHELEACKTEVKRERTRVLEREEIIVAQQRDFQRRKKNTRESFATSDAEKSFSSRYKKILDEKKALESLISTLRSHLSRLSIELSSQQAQLNELRSLRESDLKELKEKVTEVDHLKMSIEQLGDEIEVLRNVVEEGLQERRRAKEYSFIQDTSSKRLVDPSQDVEEAMENRSKAESAPHSAIMDMPSPPPSRPQSRQDQKSRVLVDRANRTDYATAGSSQPDIPEHRGFIERDEFSQLSSEVEERRSERSASTSGHSDRPEAQILTRQDDSQHVLSPAPFPVLPEHEAHSSANVNPPDSHLPNNTSRPTSPMQTKSSRRKSHLNSPFPQIRGKRLKRLFFSAPEHDTKTCRVCCRHFRPSVLDDELDSNSWLPPRKRTRFAKTDDRYAQMRESDRGLESLSNAPFSEDRLPPQTVLTRVLRELEDDFTHYKGIYTELADQYKLMDAASNVPKRNILAEHLKDVVNTLEQRGDQIASLYDLLTFTDKPMPGTATVKETPYSSHQQADRKRHGSFRNPTTYI